MLRTRRMSSNASCKFSPVRLSLKANTPPFACMFCSTVALTAARTSSWEICSILRSAATPAAVASAIQIRPLRHRVCIHMTSSSTLQEASEHYESGARRDRLPVDFVRVALIQRTDEGNDLPDLVVLEHTPKCCWHGLLWNFSFDQLEQGEIITAKFPFVIEEGWAHATTAAGPVAGRAASLKKQRTPFLDRLRIPCVRV